MENDCIHEKRKCELFHQSWRYTKTSIRVVDKWILKEKEQQGEKDEGKMAKKWGKSDTKKINTQWNRQCELNGNMKGIIEMNAQSTSNVNKKHGKK